MFRDTFKVKCPVNGAKCVQFYSKPMSMYLAMFYYTYCASSEMNCLVSGAKMLMIKYIQAILCHTLNLTNKGRHGIKRNCIVIMTHILCFKVIT